MWLTYQYVRNQRHSLGIWYVAMDTVAILAIVGSPISHLDSYSPQPGAQSGAGH
jgi:hypothetical protein